MRRAVSGAPAGLMAMVLWSAAPAAAQQQTCELNAPATATLVVLNSGTPYEMRYIGGGATLMCQGGTRIRADSAVVSRAAGTADFIGNVSFADTAKTLTASTARYYSRDRQLAAQGRPELPVVLTDLRTGSTIRSPNLNYFQLLERIEIYSGRPVATLYRTPPEQRVAGDTTIVVSDAMTIQGQQSFVGTGNVVMARGEVNARALQRAIFSDSAGTLRLVGDAVVELDSATLRGDSILAWTEAAAAREGGLAASPERRAAGAGRRPTPDTSAVPPDSAAAPPDSAAADTIVAVAVPPEPGTAGDPDAFREVLALGGATLETRDVRAEGPRIAVLFDAGAVERLVVLGERADPEAGPEGPVPPRARASSEQFVMVADSIDALAPGRVLNEVVAVGNARGVMRDTAAADTVGVPAIARENWIEGDTLRAFFTGGGPAQAEEPGDPAAELESGADRGERVIERLVAVGAPAGSLFRQRAENAEPGDPWDISYLLAQRIVVRLANGEVTSVDAQGDVKGIQLTPGANGSGQGGAGR